MCVQRAHRRVVGGCILHSLHMLRLCSPLLRRTGSLCLANSISAQISARHVKSASQQNWRSILKPFPKKSRFAFAKRDGVDISRDHLCYDSGLRNYMLFASTITLFGGAGVISLIICTVQGKTSQMATFEVFESPYEVYVYLLVLLLFMGICAYAISHTPVRIYYTPAQRKYKMIFQRMIPGFLRSTECTPASLEVLPGNRSSLSMQFFGHVAYRDDGKRLVLMEGNFFKPIYYNVLMGYDDASVLDDVVPMNLK